MANMKISAAGFNFLMDLEGFKTSPYLDTAGLLTIGVGHLLTKSELMSGKIIINGIKVKWRNGLTVQEVQDLFKQDVRPVEDWVNKQVTVPLSQQQFVVLVSFCFNIGNDAFRNSTLLRLLNAGHYSAVPAQLIRWNRSGGRVTQGLVNRRNKEIALWLGDGV